MEAAAQVAQQELSTIQMEQAEGTAAIRLLELVCMLMAALVAAVATMEQPVATAAAALVLCKRVMSNMVVGQSFLWIVAALDHMVAVAAQQLEIHRCLVAVAAAVLDLQMQEVLLLLALAAAVVDLF